MMPSPGQSHTSVQSALSVNSKMKVIINIYIYSKDDNEANIRVLSGEKETGWGRTQFILPTQSWTSRKRSNVST